MQLVTSEKEFLRKAVPNRMLYYVIFLPVLLTAFIPFFYRIHRGDNVLLSVMALFVLSAFWFVQLQTVYTAVQSMRRDWHESVPDELVGTTNRGQIVVAKFRAVLAHRWHWHLLLTIVIGGLALSVAGYLSRIPMIEQIIYMPDGNTSTQWYPMLENAWDKGMLRDYVLYSLHQPLWMMSHIPNPKAFLFAGVILAIANTASMVLSITIGLAIGRHTGTLRPVLARVAIPVVGLLIFGSMFILRGTAMNTVYRMPFSDQCRQMNGGQFDCDKIDRDTLMLRVVESTGQVGMALSDGGALSSAILLFTDFEPTGYMADSWIVETSIRDNYPPNVLFMFRHALVVLSAAGLQFLLAGVFLSQAIRSFGAKKKGE